MAEPARHAAQPTRGLGRIWALVLLALAIGILAWGGAYSYTADAAVRNDLVKVVGAAGATLAFGGVVGGLLTQVFKWWDERRKDQAAEQAFYRAMLDDLKAVYDLVERSRLLIEAHKSAKTYGEQMRTLPDADIKLHNIRRALRPGFPELQQDIEAPLRECSSFIQTLTGEFRREYKRISNLQAADEARNKEQRENYAKGVIPRDKLELADEAWRAISALEALKVLREEDRSDEYYVGFLWHIDVASLHLRRRLDGGSREPSGAQMDELRKKRETAMAKRRDRAAVHRQT